MENVLNDFQLLIELRDKYRDGWTPVYSQLGWVIKKSKTGKYKIYLSTKFEILSLGSKTSAEKFLNDNLDIIKRVYENLI